MKMFDMKEINMTLKNNEIKIPKEELLKESGETGNLYNNEDENFSVSLKLMFIGACGTVTGSCSLLRYTRGREIKNILVDCGQVQNEKFPAGSYQYLMGMAPKIDMIFLTHAHQDHIGLLPELIGHGFTGKVWCTKATKELTEIMLADQLKIEQIPDDGINKILSKIQFNVFEEYEKAFRFGTNTSWTGIAEGLNVGVFRSSHILGSCSYTFRWNINGDNEKENWRYIAFSGDLGPVKEDSENSMTLKDLQVPYYGEYNPYIVLESTYGSFERN